MRLHTRGMQGRYTTLLPLGDWVDSVKLDIFAAKIKYYILAFHLPHKQLGSVSVALLLFFVSFSSLSTDLDAHEDETLYQQRFSWKNDRKTMKFDKTLLSKS